MSGHYHPARWTRGADGKLTGRTRSAAAAFVYAVHADNAARDAYGADAADPVACDCADGERTALIGWVRG